ncbi:MAG: methyltransferase domain-containing protein [Nitrospirae bacterium]|nr:MAG: methyltransferase domain-containing protein [Nitrospirota bacterium]
MRVFKRIQRAVNARILKRWGHSSIKKAIWNEEFSSGQWDYLEHTSNDPIYDYLARYSHHGNVLDLGCGSSNTGNEMDASTYRSYTGVDISDSAIRKALTRAINNNRQLKNEYVCDDISSYVPRTRYDVILFRESIFYLPNYQIKKILNRYSSYLSHGGVFIVRMCDRRRHGSIVRLIETHHRVLEKSSLAEADIILVFR